ncbi:hypothetical protein ACP3TI_04710, partial [Desulforudis sp. 1190]|uniref:hypothetical protein n=1 Tax=Desulforudis sp. 1190 TaxID=3416136 RepID=UPI003CF2385A
HKEGQGAGESSGARRPGPAARLRVNSRKFRQGGCGSAASRPCPCLMPYTDPERPRIFRH